MEHKVCYCVRNKLSLVLSLTQMNPIRNTPSFFFKVRFNILIYAKILQATSSLEVFLSKLCMHFSSPHIATCPAHLIFLALIARVILGEE